MSEVSFGRQLIARARRHMGREIWQQERDELRVVLEELQSGKIGLRQGQGEILASLRRRIAYLDAKLGA